MNSQDALSVLSAGGKAEFFPARSAVTEALGIPMASCFTAGDVSELFFEEDSKFVSPMMLSGIVTRAEKGVRRVELFNCFDPYDEPKGTLLGWIYLPEEDEHFDLKRDFIGPAEALLTEALPQTLDSDGKRADRIDRQIEAETFRRAGNAFAAQAWPWAEVCQKADVEDLVFRRMRKLLPEIEVTACFAYWDELGPDSAEDEPNGWQVNEVDAFSRGDAEKGILLGWRIRLPDYADNDEYDDDWGFADDAASELNRRFPTFKLAWEALSTVIPTENARLTDIGSNEPERSNAAASEGEAEKATAPAPLYRRFDQNRQVSIEVVRSTGAVPKSLSALISGGLAVETENPDIVRAFGIPSAESLDAADERLNAVLSAGGFVFTVRLGEKDGRLAAYVRDEGYPADGRLAPAGCGIAAFAALTPVALRTLHFPDTRENALRRLRKRMIGPLEAALNGDLWEARIRTEDGTAVASIGYGSPEAALEEAVRQWPQCCYSDADFKEGVLKRLAK